MYIVGPVFVCTLGNFGLILTLAVTIVAKPMKFTQGMIPMGIVGAVSELLLYFFAQTAAETLTTFGFEADILIAALLCYYVMKRSEGTRDMR